MDNLNGGCGCLVASLVIVGVCWMCVGGSDSGSRKADTPPVAQPYVPTQTSSAPPTNYVPTRSVPAATGGGAETPDDAYNNGYDEGYSQGLEDGRNGHGHSYGYDDSSEYYNYYETRYQEGYEEGYNDGYDEGRSDYERENDE